MKTRDVWCLALLAGILLPVESSWGIEIDVTQAPYNAVPNDGISDRPAIQAAINALPVEGGTILFPAGIYDLDGDLVISDDDTMSAALRDKPVFLKGSTYAGSFVNGTSGSMLRRTSSGNILRVNLNSSNYGYNKQYTKLSVANMVFQGDSANSGQVTAIRGYRSRINLQNITFSDCYNGIYMDNSGAAGTDYSDSSRFINLRFHGKGWGGEGIRIRGADATILSGIHMEEKAYQTGIHLIDTQGMSMNNLLINSVATAVQLDNCSGIAIFGWHSEGYSSKGLYTVNSRGITVEGFCFWGVDNTSRFCLTGQTVGVKIRNGSIQSDGGYDLQISDTTRNVEFDNVGLFDFVNCNPRGPLMDTIATAKGKYAGTTSDLNGLPFIQLKGTDKTTTLFEVNSAGELVLKSGVKILTGSGSPLYVVSAPVGSLYLRTNGGSKTTLYVKESGTGTSGWVGK